MKLTKSQKQAVSYDGRNLQLIACAGSGKTEVVAQRVARLLTKRGKSCLKPRNIVAFTFTNKAAVELKERIIRRTNEAAGHNITGIAEIYVGTIHGFCQELLQSEVPKYLKYEVLEPIQQTLYVDRKSSKTGLTKSKKLDGKPLRRWVDTGRYLSTLNVLREDNVSKQKLDACSVADGLKQYRAQMAEDSYFDFSALLEIAVEELKSNKALRAQISERVKYVVVDEYQDVNPVQEKLVELLYNLGAGLCVVGDDDQTIYQWRGSSVGNILNFRDRYPDVKQIRLEENFRSSEGVIATAREFIERVSPRLPKAMKFADAQSYELGDVVALSFDSPEEEADYIVETIKSLHGVAFDDGDGERGLSWSDMVVLLRSVKYNGEAITGALKKANIPFVVSGLANLFETEEACAARHLFHFITGQDIRVNRTKVGPPTVKELRQSWESSCLGLAKSKLTSALRYAEKIRDELDTGNGDSSPSIQEVFLKFLELAELLEENVPDDRGQVAMFHLGRFSEVISDWETVHFASKAVEGFEGFARFLYYQADGSYGEGAEDSDYIVPDAVQVMTVHQAKGREWPAVFLPALLKNRFPSPAKRSELWNLIPSEAVEDAERYNGSIEDERRLFYVAMTRGKKFLHMTWAPVEGKNNRYTKKSRFWDDVLVSKWVKRRKPSYAKRELAPAKPRAAVANVEFSFSDLKYLFECRYQFKLRVLYGFNSPIARPMGYGKSLHDALAEVHQRAMRGEAVSEKHVPELVDRHLRTPYAFGELRETLKQAAHRDITNYICDNADKFQRIEFSEQAVEVHLDDGVSIKGRIDLVRRTDTDETTIVDLKSNKRSQQEAVTETQLHTYALGYKELTGRDADFVEIYELEERHPIPRRVDEEFINDVRKKTREAASALREMRLEPAPTAQKCRQCDFSSLCGASLAGSRHR